MDRTIELGTQSIGKLLWKYSIPGVIAMTVNAFYNVLDRIFIGKFSGETALAGLTVAFPFMMLTFAFAGLIATGGASLIAIRFGEKNHKGSEHVFANVVTASFGLGIIIAVLGLLNLSSLLTMFGANEEIMPYAADFMRIILLGTPFQFLSFSLSFAVRAEGKPKLSMASQISSVLVNLVLALILVAWLRLGVEGAAWSTLIAQLFGLGVFLPHYLSGKSILKPGKKEFQPDLKLILKICGVGASSFLGTLGVSASITFLTTSALKYGGVPAVTSLGVINSLFALFIMPIMGIQQGLQPIVGYNHGAGNHLRAKKALFIATGAGMAVATFVFLLLEIFPHFFIGLFIQPNSETIPVAVKGLRIFMLMLPVVCINIMGSGYFQSIAKAGSAIFLGMSRQFLFLIPAVIILSGVFGLTGTWVSAPVADGLSVLVTIAFLQNHFRKVQPSRIMSRGRSC